MAKKMKVNPRRRSATVADVNKAKNQAQQYAIAASWAIFFTALRDKEGWGKKRLNRLWAEVNELADSITRGYVTVPDLVKTLAEEAEIYLEFGSNEN